MFGYYLHKEGRESVAWAAVLVLLLVLLSLWLGRELYGLWIVSGMAFLLFLAVLFFFRIPAKRRYSETSPLAVLCPADGRIVDISRMEESEYFKGVCTKVSVFMSPANVHVNRYPVSGRVVYRRYHPGKFLVAWHEKSSTLNEHNTVVVRTQAGTEVLVRQIAGAVARRIVSYAEEGKDVASREELGFIKFGSRVDLFLPVGSQVCVSLGQKVKGGIDTIAWMNS